jgi:hypothetical protein
MTDIRLSFFQTSILQGKQPNININQGLDEPCAIPDPWFLITHPKGNIVMEGGNALDGIPN